MRISKTIASYVKLEYVKSKELSKEKGIEGIITEAEMKSKVNTYTLITKQ